MKMNLMTFANMLAAGKSFLNGERSAVYRKLDRKFVPVFNGGKNPFATKSAVEPVRKAVATPLPVRPVALEPAVATVAPAVVVPKEKTLWPVKLGLFRPMEAKNVFARPVQPELSLEAVKPVQNDFAEADIERVPAKSRTIAPPNGAWQMLPNAG